MPGFPWASCQFSWKVHQIFASHPLQQCSQNFREKQVLLSHFLQKTLEPNESCFTGSRTEKFDSFANPDERTELNWITHSWDWQDSSSGQKMLAVSLCDPPNRNSSIKERIPNTIRKYRSKQHMLVKNTWNPWFWSVSKLALKVTKPWV